MCSRCLFFVFVTVPISLLTGLRLLFFVLCLLPGFVQFAWYYFVVASRTSVKYGQRSCRQTLDVYQARNVNASANQQGEEEGNEGTPLLKKRPVVVFFPGGAWLIGYKLWGALTARALTACGIIVVIPDYRNYPWSTVPGMVDDVSAALQWTRENIEDYNGDASNIVVIGQSAGGHLAVTALLRQALGYKSDGQGDNRMQPSPQGEGGVASAAPDMVTPNDSNDEAETAFTWEATDFKGLITLSAPFDLQAMSQSFQKHGLDAHLVQRIFGSNTEGYDPKALLEAYYHNQQQPQTTNDEAMQELLSMPPIRVCHGDADKTVPASEDFVVLLQQCLQQQQQHVSTTTYPGWSHTDAILEGPMMAQHTFHRDVFEAVRQWTTTTETQQQDASSSSQVLLDWPDERTDPSLRPLCPRCLVHMGRFFMPF